MTISDTPKYPLLEAMLAIDGLSLKATYNNHDVASMFKVSVRAIQERIASGQLIARDLPGRSRFLSVDLEEYLQKSKRRPK